MHDLMIELRPDEFRELIDDHFQMLYASGNTALEYAPIVARLFSPQADVEMHKLKLEIFASVAARRHFRLHAPPWAPSLPIRRDEIDAMKDSESCIDRLVGIHAESLKWQGWNYQIHPSFFDHVCGIVEAAPEELQDDPALQQIFPAKKLLGLDKDLCWRSVEEVSQWRASAEDTIRRGHETENAHWIRAGTEDLAAADRIYPTLAAPRSNVIPLNREEHAPV